MIIYHYHYKENISQTASKHHAEMVLVISFNASLFAIVWLIFFN